MATIKTAIQIQDKMTPAFQSMNKALNIVLNAFEKVQNVSSKAIDTASIQTARNELVSAKVAIDNVEKGIRNAENAQDKFNESMSRGQFNADGLLNKVKNIALAVGGMNGIQKIFELSDQMATTKARLNLIVDDGGSVEELENKIFDSAMRSRANYQDTADMISKLGSQAKGAFKNNDELIAFAEQLNKNFVLAGTSQQGIESAQLQLTQALASGVLRGEELNAVFENATPVIQKIADYLDVDIGKIRDMASEGQLSAEIVKNALLASSAETNAAFEEMPMTWAQIWTKIKNIALKAFQPVLEKISSMANDPEIQNSFIGLVSGVSIAAQAILQLIDGAIWLYGVLEPFIPLIMGIVGAYVAFNVISSIVCGILNLMSFAQSVHTAATNMQNGATLKATASQYGMNTALLACPLTWIVIGIIAVIAAIYLFVSAWNKATGSTVSATGIIMGIIYSLAAYIYNTFIVYTWNAIAAFVNFFGNVFKDPCGAVKILFYNLAENVIGYIETMAKAIEDVINKIPGVEVDITSGLSSFKNKITEAAQKVKDETGWVEIVGTLDYWDYSDAAHSGYEKGVSIESSISNMSLDKLLNKDKDENPIDLSGIPSNVGDIAGNTGSIKNSLDCTEEDLKYLRDIAEQETINRFTTAEIKIDMTNNNNINNNNDIDGIIEVLEERLHETMEIAAEGVHE